MAGNRGTRARRAWQEARRWWGRVEVARRGRGRPRQRGQNLLEVHDLGSLQGAELDSYIERIKRPDSRIMLPWLTIMVAPAADVLHHRAHPAWLAWLALAAFCALYAMSVISAFDERPRFGVSPKVLVGASAVIAYAGAIGFRHNWITLIVMLAFACGTVFRGRHLGQIVAVLAISAGVVAGHGGASLWSAASIAYATFVSGLVTGAILSLYEVIGQLRSARQELARAAVNQERLRFSRDLHDLLGHTMSVVVVKAEAVRRLAPRDLDAALGQAADIESVARQALTEIREAVSGYREGSLTTELDRARSALEASGVELTVTESGPPLPPQAAALLGWVVREGVTNVVRHSGASSCRIELRTQEGRARLDITDDGDGSGAGGGSGNGLKGLKERLAMAGGSLTPSPIPRGGFRLTAELPVDGEELG
ncbi:histidine kinase [Streptomyces sp. ICBB 8177]|uniref:sensor histidine kinase n=1 Tax=Streptomyces sp. ICBB 8177 TaxID=563922 RepID=UPI001F543ECA|nr:histidine kinase [Streptomyces sp. ICBB 8177]